MTKLYSAGSEWRKWDLHVHVPGTSLSDGYDKNGGQLDWDRAAEIIELSDVAVVGITDYFSIENTMAFIKHYKAKYPASEKLLLVNVELRLNETVNGNSQNVDFHVLFADSISEAQLKGYMGKLKTQLTGKHGRQKSCAELTSVDIERATITRADLRTAFEETFGPRAEPTDFLIYLAPANNNGLRAARGNQRTANLADEIDKVAHAIFGKDPDNAQYYLRTDRFEDKSQQSKPKPVFGGCDAHNFRDLESWLGKAVASESTRQVITWVKADPTFAGLQQTLVEPRDRVSIAELKPDAKDIYKVIRRVIFEKSSDFPEEIVFNPNLNAIIGSRSSGKSALLAHIAHAIAPDYTIDQQLIADPKARENDVGPAAGFNWKSVESTVCRVEWGDGTDQGGSIIYIPQNWLYRISDNPREVTDKIRPVLESQYPKYFREQERLLDAVKSTKDGVETATTRWFELSHELVQIRDGIKQIGDKKSIEKASDDLKEQIEELRAQNALSVEDLEKYRAIIADIDQKRTRVAEIDVETEDLSAYVVERPPETFTAIPGAASVEVRITPDPKGMPHALAEILIALVDEAEKNLKGKLEVAMVDFRVAIASERKNLDLEASKAETDNQDLIERHKANTTLDELVKRLKTQQNSLDKIKQLETRQSEVESKQKDAAAEVVSQLSIRTNTLMSLKEAFSKEPRQLDQLTFGIEFDFDAGTLRALTESFSKRDKGTFLRNDGDGDQIVDIVKAHNDPSAFMLDLLSRKQKLNQGYAPVDVAKSVFAATPEVRFTAELETDRIGGFHKSTMTPGKQALFALTLILGEAQERWALLIDQPEDDLDSRSIYDDIVRYLVEQKRQRQIILVTHNANLVVGADAEEILVANRHGDDRKNKDGRTFDYLSGSLEHSQLNSRAAYELDRMGIREHAVEILDGGEEAFQKRRDKYKI